jgi:hypothetical protein
LLLHIGSTALKLLSADNKDADNHFKKQGKQEILFCFLFKLKASTTSQGLYFLQPKEHASFFSKRASKESQQWRQEITRKTSTPFQ